MPYNPLSYLTIVVNHTDEHAAVLTAEIWVRIFWDFVDPRRLIGFLWVIDNDDVVLWRCFRELLAKTLALAEYDVDTAPDGRAALERLRLGHYGLLIADLKMPGMDGLTLIREAKRLKSDIPVIIITGFSTESSAIEAINLGVAGYLTKPFRVPQVLAAAARALGE